MAGADIVLAQRLGLKPPETLRARQRKRRDLRRALGVAPRRRPAYADIVRFLASTPCQLVSLSLEDLLGSSTQVNLPGTFREYPNWRHRLHCDEGKLRQALRQVAALFPARKTP
jgi:4-alpha-glucanotransferase